MQRTKSIWLTLLVVMEDGSDATATDHSTFKTSKIKVSTCPGIIRNKKFINECQKKKNIETREKLLKAALHLIHIRTQFLGQWDIEDLNTRIQDLVIKVKTTSIATRQGLNVHKFYKYKLFKSWESKELKASPFNLPLVSLSFFLNHQKVSQNQIQVDFDSFPTL